MADKAKKEAEKAAEQKEETKCAACGEEECDCDEDDEIFELVDDEGNVVNFYPVASFEYKDEEYMVFEPAEDKEDFHPGEAVIFQVTHEDEEVVYTALESEEKLNEVFQEFLRLQEEYDEEDCEDEACTCGCHSGEGCDCKH